MNDWPMAVMLQLAVGPATQDQFNELDALVGQAMMQAGGPPSGLMSHAVYPSNDGFMIAEVWASGADGNVYIDSVIRPLIGELGFVAGATLTFPVWSFARP